MVRFNMIRHRYSVQLNRMFGKLMGFDKREIRAVELKLRPKEIYVTIPLERYN